MSSKQEFEIIAFAQRTSKNVAGEVFNYMAAYIDEEGYCTWVEVKDNIVDGSPLDPSMKHTVSLIRDGYGEVVPVFKCLPVSLAATSSAAATLSLLRFLLKIGNKLNPFCRTDSYTPGGIVKYGAYQFYLQESPVPSTQGIWPSSIGHLKEKYTCSDSEVKVTKAFDVTTNSWYNLFIHDKGFYVNSHVVSVYFFFWSLCTNMFEDEFDKIPISHFKFNLNKVLEFFGGEDAGIDKYSAILEFSSAFSDEDTKLRLIDSLQSLVQGDHSKLKNLVEEHKEFFDPSVKDKCMSLLEDLKYFDLNGKEREAKRRRVVETIQQRKTQNQQEHKQKLEALIKTIEQQPTQSVQQNVQLIQVQRSQQIVDLGSPPSQKEDMGGMRKRTVSQRDTGDDKLVHMQFPEYTQ